MEKEKTRQLFKRSVVKYLLADSQNVLRMQMGPTLHHDAKAAPALLSRAERTSAGCEQVEQVHPLWEVKGCPSPKPRRSGAEGSPQPQEERTLSLALSLNTDDLICCKSDMFFESIRSIILLALDLK